PNFKVEVVDGLKVRFQNLTPYHNEGWWDFGDGAPLAPVTADQQTLEHDYPRPGSYTAKMTLHNLLGEEGERAVPITVTGQPAAHPASDNASPPLLEFNPAAMNEFAPATFAVKGKVETAKLCVWSLDGKMRITTDGSGEIERVVTIEQPGEHSLTLAAFDG